MNHLASRLAGLALAIPSTVGLAAHAQTSLANGALTAQVITASNGCKDVKFTNHTDHLWVVQVDYHYSGKNSSGDFANQDWQASTTVYPRSSSDAWTGSFAASGSVDCEKYHYEFSYSATPYDKTEEANAIQKQYDDSTKQVIANELNRQAEVKRQNDLIAAQKQAEADARAARAAQQQAERDRQAQAARDFAYQQQQAKLRSDRAIIDAGDPRCRAIDLQGYYNCMKIVGVEDERDRLARIAAQEKAKADAEAAAQGARRVQMINSLQSQMNPDTCVVPGFTAANDQERYQIQQSLDLAAAHCQQLAIANRAAAQKQQAQIAAAQAEAQRQIALQQQAQIQAQMQAQNQQTLNQAASSISAANADTWAESRNIQNNNADLEAWLNSH